jgi:hypothetical protein
VEIMHFSGLGGIRSYIEFATNCVNSGVGSMHFVFNGIGHNSVIR